MSQRARGFTLLEVLVALVLLAAGLALAFATLRSATALAERGELRAQSNERMRAVQGFLRRNLSSALPLPFHTDPATFRQSRFLGEPQRLRFVADLPGYLGRGGPYLYDIQADEEGRLQAHFSLVQTGQTVEDAGIARPELLADGLRSVRFRYRAMDGQGRLGPWQDAWRSGELLPLQVAMDVRGADGRAWPTMIVSLMHSEGGAGGGGELVTEPP